MAKKKAAFGAQDELDALEQQMRELSLRRAQLRREAAAEAEAARIESLQACGSAVVDAIADGDWLVFDFDAFAEYLTDNSEGLRGRFVREEARRVAEAHADALACSRHVGRARKDAAGDEKEPDDVL